MAHAIFALVIFGAWWRIPYAVIAPTVCKESDVCNMAALFALGPGNVPNGVSFANTQQEIGQDAITEENVRLVNKLPSGDPKFEKHRNGADEALGHLHNPVTNFGPGTR